MATAVVKLLDSKHMISFYTTKDVATLAKELQEKGAYVLGNPAVFPGVLGEDAAEEMFDLTNNPGREDERAAQYGNGRSVSVGDIVMVDGVDFLCCSIGWKELTAG